MLPLQFSSVTQSCLTFCNQINHSRPGLPVTNSCSLPKLMSIETVMPSNHLILYHSLLLLPSIFPSIRVISNELVFASGGQNAGVSASGFVFPMDMQDWFSLGLTGWISLQSKGLSKESSLTPQFKSIISLVLSFFYGPTHTSIQNYWKNHSLN